MITHKCDAAGCTNTSTEPLAKLGGLDLCPRCNRMLAAHILVWLKDSALQAEARQQQEVADKQTAEQEKEDKIAHEMALDLAAATHAANRLGTTPERMMELLTARKVEGYTNTEAIRLAIKDELDHRRKLKEEADEVAAKVAQAKAAADRLEAEAVAAAEQASRGAVKTPTKAKPLKTTKGQ